MNQKKKLGPETHSLGFAIGVLLALVGFIGFLTEPGLRSVFFFVAGIAVIGVNHLVKYTNAGERDE